MGINGNLIFAVDGTYPGRNETIKKSKSALQRLHKVSNYHYWLLYMMPHMSPSEMKHPKNKDDDSSEDDMSEPSQREGTDGWD